MNRSSTCLTRNKGNSLGLRRASSASTLITIDGEVAYYNLVCLTIKKNSENELLYVNQSLRDVHVSCHNELGEAVYSFSELYESIILFLQHNTLHIIIFLRVLYFNSKVDKVQAHTLNDSQRRARWRLLRRI